MRWGAGRAAALAMLVMAAAVGGCGRGGGATTTAATAGGGDSMEGMSSYPYLMTDGGPDLLLPAAYAEAWKGTPSTARDPDPKSDYGKACAATEHSPYGVVAMGGGGQAVAFADPDLAAWGTSADGLVEVYCVESCESRDIDGLIRRATASLATSQMKDSGSVLDFPERDAFLMFGADTTADPNYPVRRVKIAAGRYRLLVGRYSADGDKEEVRVYRLERVKGGS